MTMRRFLASLAWTIIIAAPRIADAEWLYALTRGNTLGVFEAMDPTQVVATIPVTGLQPFEQLEAIDFRPRDGQLYALAGSSNEAPLPPCTARLYRINMLTGAATPIGSTPLTMDCLGVSFDFDARDDIARVVSPAGLNFRVNPDTGAMLDGDPVQTGIQPDTPLQAGTSISGTAYSNNFVGTAGTTLYGIDVVKGAFSRIGGPGGTPSPNGGVVTAIGPPSSLPGSSHWGLDIVASNRIFACIETGADTDLRLIDLTLGSSSLVGRFAHIAGRRVVDIALPHRPVTMYGLTRNDRLVTFRSNFPMSIQTNVAITGLLPNEHVMAIDVRPENGEIYGLTSGAFRLVRINPTTGFAVAVSDTNLGWSETTGVSFDHITGHLRALTADAVHADIDLTTTPVTMTGTPILVVGGQPILNVTDIAHAFNPFANTSAFFAIDALTDDLLRIAPNGIADRRDLERNVLARSGFDIDPASNTAYVMNEVAGTGYFLYMLGLPFGGMTLIDRIGEPAQNLEIQDIAVALPGVVRFKQGSKDVDEPAGTVAIEVVREGGSGGAFSIDYATHADSAEAPNDFTPRSGTLIFLDGQVSKTITVPIVNDTTYDAPIETFIVTLSNPTLGVRLSSSTTTTVRIVDDEKLVGQLPVVTITAPTTSPTFDTSGVELIDLAGTASDDGSIVSVTWSDDNNDSGTAQGTTHWMIPGLSVAGLPRVVTVTAHDNLGQTSSDTITLTRDFSRDFSYVLAEGATGAFFDLDILLANAGSVSTKVVLTFLKEDGSTIVATRTLAAMSRMTVRVDEIPGMESTAASTVVTSAYPIIVERTMRWAGGAGYGAHTEKAVERATETWYFAEGSQGFFSTYLLLANPNASENTATVEYLREGESPLTRTYTLAASSRLTVDAGADPELVNRSFGMTVTFAKPGVAERAMYFGTDPFWKAGHESAGVTLPSTSWFLAEGATGPFFETFVLLSNPQTTAAEVTLTFLIADGTPVTKTKTVPAHGRLTVNIEQEDPALANVAVATQVSASVPIVVERAQYWPYTFDQWYEAHNSFGVIATADGWGLAEGRVGGPDKYETYILLANPATDPAQVRITFLRTNGTTIEKTFVVPPQSRFNVSTGPGSLVPELVDEEFGAVILSDHNIAVERAMYASPGGLTWSAGTNATATRIIIE